jgi:hypothetical protein
MVPHPGLSLSPQWGDPTFENWNTAMNAQIEGAISSENGVLTVTMDGPRQTGDIVAAQKTNDLPNDLDSQSYLKVAIMTSSIDVAARIVIWTTPSHFRDILVKTYNDRELHTEIVDLSFFDISGEIYMIELSMMQIYSSNHSDWVSYSQLTFERMEL